MNKREYLTLEKTLTMKWQSLPVSNVQEEIHQADMKFSAIERLNKAWDSVPQKVRDQITNMPKIRKYPHGALAGEWSRNANAEKEAFAKDVLQPTKKDGTINKHFVQAHGTKEIQKELKMTKKEIHEHIDRYG